MSGCFEFGRRLGLSWGFCLKEKFSPKGSGPELRSFGRPVSVDSVSYPIGGFSVGVEAWGFERGVLEGWRRETWVRQQKAGGF